MNSGGFNSDVALANPISNMEQTFKVQFIKAVKTSTNYLVTV